MAISQHKIFQKLGIVFDENHNTLISEKKLQILSEQFQSGEIYFVDNTPPDEGYLLVEKNGNNFDIFPSNEIEEWEKDGSIEQGDILYQIKLVKRY